MDTQAFIKAYNESRNGANEFVKHALARRFIYSDGVKDCAEAGCYWLLDILATELTVPWGERAVVTVAVKDGRATIVSHLDDDLPPNYKKQIDLTDLPDGEWKFLVSNDGQHHVCTLISEY